MYMKTATEAINKTTIVFQIFSNQSIDLKVAQHKMRRVTKR